MRRVIMSTFILVSVLSTMALPAHAVLGGQRDGTTHPNVGCVVPRFPDGSFGSCATGQLVSSTVVVTAAHVTSSISANGLRAFVSFDPHFDPATSTMIRAKSVATDPDWNPTNSSNDVGVIVLSTPVEGVTPIELPTQGLLRQMTKAGTLQRQEFVTVGYGVSHCSSNGCGGSNTRRHGAESMSSVGAWDIHMQLNTTATGLGGVCFGDSGGPHFLGGSNLSVGVTSWVESNGHVCQSTGGVQRLDTPSVRSFLSAYVTLP